MMTGSGVSDSTYQWSAAEATHCVLCVLHSVCMCCGSRTSGSGEYNKAINMQKAWVSDSWQLWMMKFDLVV